MTSTVRTYRCIADQLVEHKNLTKTLREWADILGIKYSVIKMRYTRGLRGDDLFHAPVNLNPMMHAHDRLYALDKDLRIRVIKKANEMEIDPIELVNQCLEHYMDKLDK